MPRWSGAVALALAACALGRWLEPLGRELPYQVPLAAVAFSALYGGIASGLITLAFTAAAAAIYLASADRLSLTHPQAAWPFAIFLALGAAVAWLAGKLSAREAKMAGALSGLGEAAAISDQRGRVVFLNPAAETLTGWERKQAAGHPLREVLHLVSEQTGIRIENPLAGALASGPADPGAGILLRSKDGAVRAIEESVAPIRTDRGAQGAIVVLRDVTARREREEQLRHSQRIEALGRLAGGLAHDFNNILTVISGHAELLSARLAARSDPLGREHAFEIQQAACRAAQLTRQLVMFGRGQTTGPVALDLNQLLLRLQPAIRSQGGAPVDLSLDLDQRPAWVNCDPAQLEQVIVGLAVNAREATPDRCRLAISTRHRQLKPPLDAELTGLEPGAHIELTVATAGSATGTSSGLPAVCRIVKQWGGVILASHRPGQATAFTIYLPEAARDVGRPEPAAPQPLSDAGSRTVLISEHDVAVRALMSSVLRQAGHTVLEAADCIEAARMAADEINRIDLMVADTAMPGQSGLIDRLSLLRPELGILRISGTGESEAAARKNLRAGAAVLAKPFTATSFMAEVDRLLSRAA